MSRAIIYTSFGGPEVLELQDIAEPHAGSDEVRVRVAAAGLNPMDWKLSSMPEMAAMFGVTLPSGFGTDFAGTIDEVGSNVKDFQIGDRVFSGAIGRAVADYIVVNASSPMEPLHHTPSDISDVIASALPIAGLTADAALSAIGVTSGETVLIGGAAGGVGTFAVQLAKLAGATVIGTGSEDSFDYLRQLGAIPVTYGPGLAERVRQLAPQGVDAATVLVGTETIDAALALGISPDRISTIAAGPNPPAGVRATGGAQASPGALDRITAAIRSGELVVPIAATFPIERTREAVILQRGGHVHGKVVITLSEKDS
ncbi:NADP-dependent oxidoreductase [Dictyobacter aurantiacus]|uniref:NADPH:quinone reductase n=1 Tax=Dictyobacter aurantiacus TaxID=1936993 RepID=A0A401ZKV9_9CHLR|nr:NADP-dependent oxidoreductase [Dictyobacter aurantiacus]GCE07483.1 NADPH:quinone reductase [Dictyobacter aurantiacus]